MSGTQSTYQAQLAAELGRRKDRNARYSIRAFARDLGVSVTALSDVLGGKRHLSRRNAERVAEKLSWSPRQSGAMLAEIRGEAFGPLSDDPVVELREDEFRLIADWHYLAILNLARLPSNRADADWVARRLGLSRETAADALARLERLGYVERTAKGRLRRKVRELRTTLDVPSHAIREHHRQNLTRAAEALEKTPVERREISSVTFAIDSRSLDEAKRMIVEFKRRFANRLETDRPDEVFTLAIQFFPALSRKEEE